MAHMLAQPGLHAHSYNPDRNLMKKYLVAEKIPNSGWLALNSFPTLGDAEEWVIFENVIEDGTLVRITDEWHVHGKPLEICRFVKG